MAIPSYKQVNINFSDEKNIDKQLSMHQFGQLPYIFNISHLKDQITALRNIENHMQMKQISNYPYPIYIISDIKNHHGLFSLFEKIEHIPKFFKQKIKQLNTKENKILQKIYLKQHNLENMNGVNFKESIDEFAISHQAIFKTVKEKEFYDKIIKKLEKYYDKKI